MTTNHLGIARLEYAPTTMIELLDRTGMSKLFSPSAAVPEEDTDAIHDAEAFAVLSELFQATLKMLTELEQHQEHVLFVSSMHTVLALTRIIKIWSDVNRVENGRAIAKKEVAALLCATREIAASEDISRSTLNSVGEMMGRADELLRGAEEIKERGRALDHEIKLICKTTMNTLIALGLPLPACLRDDR